MKRKVKFLTAIIFLLTLILFLLIRLNYPINVSTTQSILYRIPFYYWILIILIPVLISGTFLLTESKSICVFLAVIYFFVLYSSYLFHIIPPTQGDMPQGGHVFHLLENTTTLSVEKLTYFEYPIHFILYKSFIEILGANTSILTLIFFSFMLMFPLVIYMTRGGSDKKIYFLLPIGYIIFAEYTYINSQWVPQFTGLFFLILTIGSYVKYKNVDSKKFYFLTFLFYTLCVFTHPFIFIFFPISIFLERYFISKKIFKPTFETNKKISITSLFVIYLAGFAYRFSKVTELTKELFYGGRAGRGEAWNIIGYLLGEGRGIRDVEYETYPLFNFVSRRIYLTSRYAMFGLLICLAILLAYASLKNWNKLKSMDISFGIAGGAFFLFGII